MILFVSLSSLTFYLQECTIFASPFFCNKPTDFLFWEIGSLCRSNLTTGAARLQPQGSYHYGQIPITKTYMLSNAPLEVQGKQRYMVNGVTFVRTSTPIKLADYLKLEGVFRAGSIPEHPITTATPSFASSVLSCPFRAMVELVFQNVETTLQSWHLNGYAFFVVAYASSHYTPSPQDQKIPHLISLLEIRCSRKPIWQLSSWVLFYGLAPPTLALLNLNFVDVAILHMPFRSEVMWGEIILSVDWYFA